MTLANRLTLLRAGLIIPFAIVALNDQRLVAGLLFAVAAATDLLDGFVARRMQEETMLGKVLDPIADKMLTITALLVLVAMGTLSGWLLAAAIAIAMREVWVTGLREGLVAGGGELPVSALAKGKTAVQLLALFVLTLSDSLLGYGLFWAATALTLVTGYQYTVVTFRVLNVGSEDPSNSL